MIHSALDQPHEAESAFEVARRLYHSEYDFLLERGRAYVQVRDLAAASSDVEQAILEEPASGAGYYVRHLIALEQGDRAAAIADLERTADLARAAGDTSLEAIARQQLAVVLQQPLSAPERATPTS